MSEKNKRRRQQRQAFLNYLQNRPTASQRWSGWKLALIERYTLPKEPGQ